MKHRFLSDEYFVSNIEKVDSVTLLRKDKLMNGVSWSIRFQQALCTWPCINDLGAGAAQVNVNIIFFSKIFFFSIVKSCHIYEQFEILNAHLEVSFLVCL